MDAIAQVPTDALASLCRRHHIRELAVFGSAARGEAGPGSDVDLLVEFDADARIGFMALARASRELSDLLGAPVDLVPKSGLKALIRESVLAEAIPLYAS